MSIGAAISRDAMGSASGNKDITVTDFGTPQAAIFFGGHAESDATLKTDVAFSIGFTDGTRERCCCIQSESGQANSDTDKRQFTDAVLAQMDSGGNVDVEAAFSQWITDGVRINLGTASLGTDALWQTILLNGFDNVYVGTVTLDTEDTAVDVTDPGFEPDLVLFITACRSEIDSTVVSAALNIGVAHNGDSLTQHSYNFLTADNQAKSTVMARYETDSISVQYADYDGNLYYWVEASDFDSNGFTLTCKNNDSGGDVVFYLALKSSAGEFYVGTMNSPTSTGNDAQTGPGFQPTLVMLIPTLLQAIDTSVAPGNNEDDVSWGVSAFTASEEFCHGIFDENDQAASDCSDISDDTAVNLYDDAHASQMFVAAFSSMDSNGWTLNFSTADGTTRKWLAIAIGEGAGNQYDETITENLAMQDSISSKGNVYGFTIVESLASGDSLGPASVDHNISLEEIVSMLDVLTVTADHNVSFEDAMALTDELKAQLESGLTLEEAIAIVDDIETSADLNINITEYLSLTDAVKTIVDIWLNISEIIALTDIISIPLPGEGDVWDETITENLAMQDTFTTSLVSYLKLEDNAALADVIRTTATMYVAIKESLALIDTIEFEGIGQAINWTLTENMAVQDQIASIVTIALSLSEDIALQDIIGDTVIFNIKLTENISLNEVLSTVLEYGLKITENLAMGEVFVLTRFRPSIVIRRGKTFVFTIDTVSPHAGVAPKKGKADIKKWH